MPKPVYHSILLKVPQEKAEEVYAALYELDCAGIVEESCEGNGEVLAHIFIKAYFENHPRPDLILSAASRWSVEPVSLVEIGLNSNHFTPAPYEPFPLSGAFWVVPPEDLRLESSLIPEGVTSLIIKPGAAFGTGRHETTRLCASLLEKIPNTGSLLDVGTGSGILALLAARLGFSPIEAVEISQEARENAMENFRLNENPSISLLQDIGHCQDRYDAVVANILTPTILHLKEELLKRLKPGGWLILSGITREEYPSISRAFSGLEHASELMDEDWVGVAYRLRT